MSRLDRSRSQERYANNQTIIEPSVETPGTRLQIAKERPVSRVVHPPEATAKNGKKPHFYSPRGSSAVSWLSPTLESTKFVHGPPKIAGLGVPLDSIYRVSDDFHL
jgi:hypothetical protein